MGRLAFSDEQLSLLRLWWTTNPRLTARRVLRMLSMEGRVSSMTVSRARRKLGIDRGRASQLWFLYVAALVDAEYMEQ